MRDCSGARTSCAAQKAAPWGFDRDALLGKHDDGHPRRRTHFSTRSFAATLPGSAGAMFAAPWPARWPLVRSGSRRCPAAQSTGGVPHVPHEGAGCSRRPVGRRRLRDSRSTQECKRAQRCISNAEILSSAQERGDEGRNGSSCRCHARLMLSYAFDGSPVPSDSYSIM